MQEDLAEVEGGKLGRQKRVGSQRVGLVRGLGGIKQSFSIQRRSEVRGLKSLLYHSQKIIPAS